VLKIRRVQPQDIMDVITLAYDTLPERYNPVIFNQFFESFPQGFLVVVNQHSLVGFLIGIKTTPSIARILMLSVQDKYRKQGIGSALLKEFLEIMKRYSVERVELEVRTTNQGALEFYKKKGFSLQHTLSKFYQNGEDAYAMARVL
jgi:[ribosomal protein S18]-alanine N-acetyltransferase